jgi:tetratricopeptide (TPR) repeat protein
LWRPFNPAEVRNIQIPHSRFVPIRYPNQVINRRAAMSSDADGVPRRKWVIAPAVLHEPGERLEGLELLDEFPPPLGILLWCVLRDVTLWATTPVEDRPYLFSEVAASLRTRFLARVPIDPDLEHALHGFTAMLVHSGSATASVIESLCQAVRAWAEGRRAFRTALAFSQARARLRPDLADAAMEAGMLAKRLNLHRRAWSWFERSVGLARRSMDWPNYGLAYQALGEIAVAEHDLEAAQRYAVKALRAARRYGTPAIRGPAYRTLFEIARDRGDAGTAVRYAQQAVRAYGRDAPGRVAVELELAHAWITSGRAPRAGAILRSVLRRTLEPSDSAAALALLARAAAVEGDRKTFTDAWTRAWSMIRQEDADAPVAKPISDLTAAAAALGDWERMEMVVRRAGGPGA